MKARSDAFELIFTDVMMPAMSGIDFARQVRRTWPDREVVLTSGYSDALARAEGLEFKLIGKPYSGRELQEICGSD